MKTIPGDLLQDLAKVRTASVWVELLSFTLPQGRMYRIANNTEPVPYAGNVYGASSFEPEIVELGKQARMPSYLLRLSNVSGELVQWLRRSGGLEGQTVTAALVSTADLAADYTQFTTTYDIRGHSDDDETIEFEIGGPNLYRHRFPFRRYMPHLCEVRFKGALCGYAGAEFACGTYTLERCRQLGNAARFGGTPGLSPQSLRVV
jgi:phage-related protein